MERRAVVRWQIPTSLYSALPYELKHIISSTLSWRAHRRLGLTCRYSLAENWGLVTSIESIRRKKEIEAFGSIPPSQLSSLRSLRVKVSGDLDSSFLDSLPLIPGLKTLILEGHLFDPSRQIIRLPTTLESLVFDLALPMKPARALLTHVCADLVELQDLSFHCEVPYPDLGQLRRLTKLKSLEIPNVVAFPHPSEALQLLRALPHQLFTHNSFCIGWIHSECFADLSDHPIEVAQSFYELGFRPDPLLEYTQLIRGAERPIQYVQKGFLDVAGARKHLALMMSEVATRAMFDRFVEYIYLPLANRCEPHCPDLKDTEAALMWMSQREGHWLSALVVAHEFFVEELLRDPSRLRFDLADQSFGTPTHWFAVNDHMEQAFAAFGFPPDLSPERLQVLVRAWSLVSKLQRKGVECTAFDEWFVFRQLLANRPFFDANAKQILELAAVRQNCQIIHHIFENVHPPISDRLLEHYLLRWPPCNTLPGPIARRLAFYTMAFGLPALYEQLAESVPDLVFEHNQNGFHVLFQRSQHAFFRKTASSVEAALRIFPTRLPPSRCLGPKGEGRRSSDDHIFPCDKRNLFKQADAFDKLPIYYWIGLLYKPHPYAPGFKRCVARLISTFRPITDDKVDTHGTTVDQELAKHTPPEMDALTRVVLEELKSGVHSQ